jgi:hypothetical protein
MGDWIWGACCSAAVLFWASRAADASSRRPREPWLLRPDAAGTDRGSYDRHTHKPQQRAHSRCSPSPYFSLAKRSRSNFESQVASMARGAGTERRHGPIRHHLSTFLSYLAGHAIGLIGFVPSFLVGAECYTLGPQFSRMVRIRSKFLLGSQGLLTGTVFCGRSGRSGGLS